MRKQGNNKTEKLVNFFRQHTTSVTLLILVLSYVMIWKIFACEVGFSPGPSLERRDWLSFLGSYLSFAGSLLMSFIIYKQERKLANLTFEQQKTNLELCIDDLYFDYHPKMEHQHVTRLPNADAIGVYKSRYYFCTYSELNGEENNGPANYLIIYLEVFSVTDVAISSIRIDNVKLCREDVLKSEPECNFNFPLISDSHSYSISRQRDTLYFALYLSSFPTNLKSGEYTIDITFSYTSYGINKPDKKQIYAFVENSEMRIVDGLKNPVLHLA